MKAYIRWLVGVACAALLVVTAATPQAWAGTTWLYMNAGQAEVPASNPCATAAITDGVMPYTVQKCSLGSNDLMYFQFTVPDNVGTNPGVTYPSINVLWYSDTDTSASHDVCFKASITAHTYGVNFKTQPLAAVGGTMTAGSTTSTPQYKLAVSSVAVIPFVDSGGNNCENSNCANRVATLALQRVACVSGVALTGAAAVTSINLYYFSN